METFVRTGSECIISFYSKGTVLRPKVVQVTQSTARMHT